MPLFNNRAGNAGTGKGMLSQIGHRIEAKKQLHSAAGMSGYSNAVHNAQGTQETSGGKFGGPSTSERLGAATSAARSAGLSERKIGKVVGKAREIGNKQGQSASAFGAGKKSPFQSRSKNLKSY